MRILKYAAGGIQFSPTAVDYSAGILSILAGNQAQGAEAQAGSQSSLFRSEEKGAVGILTKTMTDDLLQNTLPNEAQYIINNTDMFGQYIDPTNPTQSIALYSDLLQKMQMAKYNKELFNDAVSKARDKYGLKGPAINADGTVWVKGKQGIHKKYAQDVTPGDQIVTVAELSQLRAYNPQFAFNSDIISTIENTTSVKEIQEFINSVVEKIGEDKLKLNIYGNKDDLIKFQGLTDILQGKGLAVGLASGESPEGIYKGTIDHTSNTTAANKLLVYIYSLLEPNQRTYLEVMANKVGFTVYDDQTGKKIPTVQALLTEFIRGKYSTTSEYDVSFQKDETRIMYGKAAVGEDEEKGKGGSDDGLGDINANPAMRFFNEYGERGEFSIQLGNFMLSTIGTIGSLYDAQGNPMDWTSLKQVSESMFGPGLYMSSASFGGALITDRSKVQVDGNEVIMMYLPVTKSGKHTVPNMDAFRKATQLQRQTAHMKDINQINRLYRQAGLPDIFKPDGKGGKVLTNSYARFAVMHAYADKKAVAAKDVNGNNIEYDETVQVLDDDNITETVIDRFKGMDKNFSETREGGIPLLNWFSHAGIYEGLVFIPVKNHPGNYYQTGTSMRQSEQQDRSYQYGQRDVYGTYRQPTLKVNYQ